MKVLALHLPQFHAIPENDAWWGEGFTEWDNVRKATPLFTGHKQPVVPLNNNYYDLSKKEDISWQCKLARQYLVDGFIYYHYWFNGKLLLEKPCEILRNSPEIDISYCFCWANEPWARTWDGKPGSVLMPQTFGGEADWIAHIKYLEHFFVDKRYLKVGNMPMLYVYSPCQIPEFDQMVKLWNEHVKALGFDGIYLVEFISTKNPDAFSAYSQAVIEFEPLYTTRFGISNFNKAKRLFDKKLGLTDFQSFNLLWEAILSRSRTYGERAIQKSGFCGWDNSPRKGKASMIVKGSSPATFKGYFSRLVNEKRSHCNNDFIVINAWNEWGEGAMLEPTESNGYGYLEAIRSVVSEYAAQPSEPSNVSVHVDRH